MAGYFNIYTIVKLYKTKGIETLRKELMSKEKPNLLDNLALEVYNALKKRRTGEAKELLEKYSKSIKNR